MPSSLSPEQHDLFRAFMNVHWLRPEAALMKYYDAQAFYRFPVEPPSLEITCGDGTTSFITAGGRFGIDFDVYQSVGHVDRYFESRRADQYDPPDVYDHYQPLSVSIERRPAWAYDVGLDLLANSVEKARALDFYGRLVVHDCNQPLPFADNSFQTIWTTSPYFMRQVEGFFAEIHRILKPGGCFRARIPSTKMVDLLPYNLYLKHGWEWAMPIDRGLYEVATRVPSDRAFWERSMSGAGLAIEAAVPLLPARVYELYAYGFRPMFPAFMEMYRRLPREDWRAVKRTWIDNVVYLAEPFCDPAWMGETDSDAAFYLYSVRKP